MEDKILALHPEENKSSVNISRQKYQLVKEAIVTSLQTDNEMTFKEMTFKELTENVQAQLMGRFDGSIPWYVTTVKLDLEARGFSNESRRKALKDYA
jgi:hypothetical protein